MQCLCKDKSCIRDTGGARGGRSVYFSPGHSRFGIVSIQQVGTWNYFLHGGCCFIEAHAGKRFASGHQKPICSKEWRGRSTERGAGTAHSSRTSKAKRECTLRLRMYIVYKLCKNCKVRACVYMQEEPCRSELRRKAAAAKVKTDALSLPRSTSCSFTASGRRCGVWGCGALSFSG